MAKPTHTSILVTRARQGDREAFDELSASTRERVLLRIRTMVGGAFRRKCDPEDVLQETFLRGIESIERFEGEDLVAFGSWLEGIARNVVRNLVRKKGWRAEFEIARSLPASGPSPSHHQRREERFGRLSEAVESLSSDHRTVIRLARIEGLKIREVAERMGRSESAVKNLLLRAMKELRDSFGHTESLGLPDRRLGEERSDDAW